MGDLHIAAVKVVIAEYGTAHRTYKNGSFTDLQIIHCFSDEFMYNAVSASGTIMGGAELCSGFTVKFIEE
jgi:hypothetical protein